MDLGYLPMLIDIMREQGGEQEPVLVQCSLKTYQGLKQYLSSDGTYQGIPVEIDNTVLTDFFQVKPKGASDAQITG